MGRRAGFGGQRRAPGRDAGQPSRRPQRRPRPGRHHLPRRARAARLDGVREHTAYVFDLDGVVRDFAPGDADPAIEAALGLPAGHVSATAFRSEPAPADHHRSTRLRPVVRRHLRRARGGRPRAGAGARAHGAVARAPRHRHRRDRRAPRGPPVRRPPHLRLHERHRLRAAGDGACSGSPGSSTVCSTAPTSASPSRTRSRMPPPTAPSRPTSGAWWRATRSGSPTTATTT